MTSSKEIASKIDSLEQEKAQKTQSVAEAETKYENYLVDENTGKGVEYHLKQGLIKTIEDGKRRIADIDIVLRNLAAQRTRAVAEEKAAQIKDLQRKLRKGDIEILKSFLEEAKLKKSLNNIQDVRQKLSDARREVIGELTILEGPTALYPLVVSGWNSHNPLGLDSIEFQTERLMRPYPWDDLENGIEFLEKYIKEAEGKIF